jgi:hypothetical protein
LRLSSAANTCCRASATASCAVASSGPSAEHDPRRSAHVSRLLKRLHLRGVLAKIPRSRRWRVTHLEHAVMSAAVLLREEHFLGALLQDAA